MTIIKITAKTIILLTFLLSHTSSYAVTDGLLEQIRQAQDQYGPDKARQVAEGLGLLVREQQGQVMVPVIIDRPVTRTADFNARLTRAGARLDAVSRSYARLLVPAPRLQHLAEQFAEEQLRAPIPAYPAFGLGPIVSQSVALTAANGYQAGNLTGNGIKVAVVDLGFSNLSNAISQGELPPGACDASHSQDYTGTGLQATTKHGTGVAEHVLDMAPGVELYCLKVSDQVGLESAADYIAANGIHIANHSVAWATYQYDYYDGASPIDNIINYSHGTHGVFWSVASGNFARKHWHGTWLDSDGDNVLEFAANDDGLMELLGSAGTIALLLNWNQYSYSNRTDLNFELLDQWNNVVASSTRQQTRPTRNLPYEVITDVAYDSNKAPYRVRVTYQGGVDPTGLDITLFSMNHDLEHKVAASSMMAPAVASGAFSVGAVNWSSWQQAAPPIRGYSSQGPTNDGRQKPDLVAPDGTSSLSYSTATGTSFSSPTVAGAAALLLQERPWLSNTALADLLRNEAIDVGAAGADPVYGFGKLQLPLIDSDGDQLTNVEEIALGTDALRADTDSDGLTDFEEAELYGTDPLLADSDGDTLNDFDELVTYGTDPLTSNRGDLNLDGSINLGDYVVLSRLVIGEISATPTDIALGDLNYNDSLDAGDMALMARVLLEGIAVP